MITRDQALDILHSNMDSVNLRKHCYAVEATMRVLAKHFKEDEEKWGIVGLLHDADYEKWPEEHPGRIIAELEGLNVSADIINAIRAHAFGYNGIDYEPKNNLDWSIYCCDELTGFIIAVTLIRPEKKLAAVSVENILAKWSKKDFAKGVVRSQVEMCEEKLGIKPPDFMAITLQAMQNISSDLSL